MLRTLHLLLVGMVLATLSGCVDGDAGSAARSPEAPRITQVPSEAVGAGLPTAVVVACLDNSASVERDFFDNAVATLTRIVERRSHQFPRGELRLTIRMFGAQADDTLALPVLVLPGLGAEPKSPAGQNPFASDDPAMGSWTKARDDGLGKAADIATRIRSLTYVGYSGTDLWNCVDAAVGSYANLNAHDQPLLVLLSDFVDGIGEDTALPTVERLEVAFVRTCSDHSADQCRAGVEAAKQRLAHIDSSIAVFESTDLSVLDLERLDPRMKL